MNELLRNSGFFGVFLSLLAYAAGIFLKKKLKLAIFNPILIAAALTCGVLLVLKIDYSDYVAGAKTLSWLLTPTTVCLAIPLYEQISLLKKNARAILLGIGAGVIASLGSIFALAMMFGLSYGQYVTLLPKSVTTAIGMGIAEELGGNPSIAATVILLTGIMGNICAEGFLKLIRVREPIARGVAIGTASHAIGTSRAMEMGDVEGAMSSLSIVVAGLITVVGASVFAQIY